MHVALVQSPARPEAPDDAEQRGHRALEEAAEAGADLVVFPELSFAPFYPRLPVSDRAASVLDLAEPVPGPTTEAMAETAAELGLVVVFNLMERDGDHTFDTSPVIDADGTLLGRTRMMHITAYEHFHEQGYYAPGDTGAPVYDTAVGRLGVAICYDRHYPEYLRAARAGPSGGRDCSGAAGRNRRRVARGDVRGGAPGRCPPARVLHGPCEPGGPGGGHAFRGTLLCNGPAWTRRGPGTGRGIHRTVHVS